MAKGSGVKIKPVIKSSPPKGGPAGKARKGYPMTDSPKKGK